MKSSPAPKGSTPPVICPAKKKFPEFFAGDTIKVGGRIVEGKRERVQYFEGLCIAKKKSRC